MIKNDQMYIVCKHCGHYEEINAKLFAKIIGTAVTGLGYWAWISFLFAGTGFAMPLCIAIMAGGIALVAFSDEIIEWMNKNYECPNCKHKTWESLSGESLIKRINLIKENEDTQNRYKELKKNTKRDILHVSEYKKAFWQSLDDCISELDIMSIRLGSVFESEKFKEKIFAVLCRGVIIKIRCGYGDFQKRSYVNKLNNTIDTFISDNRFNNFYKYNRLCFKTENCHNKLIIVDDKYYIIGSMNVLSNTGEAYGDGDPWDELGEKGYDINMINRHREDSFSFNKSEYRSCDQ